MRFLLLFSVLCAALPVLAQEPPVETLHVSSQLVEISASVTDRNGIPQTGLTKDDFILKQDGKEQVIRYFSGGDALPLTFVVMIDTSGSQRTFLDDEARACDIFFETVLGRPQDHAALVEVNAKVTGRSDLTNDPNKLHLALTALHYDQAASVATHINDAVYSLSKSILSKVHGRKAIILISDGGDVGSRVSFSDAIAEAQRDDVPVYAISYSAWSGLDPVAPGGLSGGYVSFNHGVSDSDPGLKNLKEWASATGGNVYQVTPKTTLKRIFTDIAQLLRSQYEIGYMLPPDTKPKQFHKLELKAKDKSLRVQARTGFYTNP